MMADSLLNLINQKPGIDKIYLCIKDPYEPKCQLLTNVNKVVF